MKRILIALCIVLGAAAPAQAHHADIDAFYDAGDADAATWNQSVTEEICLSPDFRNAGFSDAQFNSVKQSVFEGFEEWRLGTDITKNINFGGDGVVQCATNYSFRTGYENAEAGRANGEEIREDYCEHRLGSQASAIEYENLDFIGSDYLALTWTCDTDDNGLIDFLVMVLDTRGVGNGGWHLDPDTTLQFADYDLPAVATHEAGHGWGFGKHWANDAETCPNTSGGHNTMCLDDWGLQGGFGGPADRTIELHDIGETNQAY